MNSLIKETNDNLKAIIDTMKGNLDAAGNTLDSIQMQMDKKVEEAKRYKIQVDSAKEAIKDLENDNKSLELSLKELNDKYGKMNLVSVIEAGNREIKAKINDNFREINKQKEQIAELTSKARTIKDLLMNLKKDKSLKEERLESLKLVYEYYSNRLNDVIDYAFNHSENLGDYREVSFNKDYEIKEEEINNKELENTMVFDEIANIDENRNFKDEMSFISEQIVKNVEDSIDTKLDETTEDNMDIFEEVDENGDIESVSREIEALDTTQVFDSIINPIDDSLDEMDAIPLEDNVDFGHNEYTQDDETSIDEIKDSLNLLDETEPVIEEKEELPEEEKEEDLNPFSTLKIDTNEIGIESEEENPKIEEVLQTDKDLEDKYLDEENEERLNKINSLFSTLNDINTTVINKQIPNNLENKIDNAYQETFGKSIDEENIVDSTLTDIFGNPIKSEEINDKYVETKSIENIFVENGIDFNKFKEDEQNYLKEIYNEEKFNNIFAVLKRNKINLDNIYSAFNIFGEISPNELENIISKLLNIGQSAEAIGIILEKLPRVKKYNLDEAIMSYGDYIKDIDITELVMKAKELYNNGGNK